MAQQEVLAEKRLRGLMGANSEQNRRKWALEWKTKGGMAIGMLDHYVPEEILYAAGMLPWRITGTAVAALPLASVYRPSYTDSYCSHVLELALAGELDFLGGIISTDWSDDTRRLWDVFEHVGKPAFRPMVHVPRQASELAYRFYAKNLRGLSRGLEELGGTRITEESLYRAIEVHNKTRRLLKKLYELRIKERPPVSGAEALGIVLAAMVMPKERFNEELEDLLAYLEVREVDFKQIRPRLLVASDRLDSPAFMALIESCGAVVVIDDLDTGSRYLWNTVEKGSDPWYDLAKGYINRPPCPRMFFWDRQIGTIVQWCKDFRVDGILNFPLNYTYDRQMCEPYFRARLTEAGIPMATVTREYHLSDEGQLKTRIQAFIEMLDATED